MNTTANYHLSQWDPEDRVLRTDFNNDNAKLDAALQALEAQTADLKARTQELERRIKRADNGLNFLSFWTGRAYARELAGRDGYDGAPGGGVENFKSPGNLILSGYASRENNSIVVPMGKTGGVRCNNGDLVHTSNWTHVQLWAYMHDNAKMKFYINDMLLKEGGIQIVNYEPTGTSDAYSRVKVYTLDLPFGTDVSPLIQWRVEIEGFEDKSAILYALHYMVF